MISKMRIELCDAQGYLGIPLSVTMTLLPEAVRNGFAELNDWLETHQVEVSGPRFVRYPKERCHRLGGRVPSPANHQEFSIGPSIA